MPMPFRICSFDELNEKKSVGFSCDDMEGFVVLFKNKIYGYRNACPHIGMSLEFAPDRFFDAEGKFIQCSMHGALFNPDDGSCVHGPCLGDQLQALKVERSGNDVVLTQLDN